MRRALMAAAMGITIAVAIFFAPLASAGEKSDRILAAELLILRGDLERLQKGDDLPAAHRRGLNDRIASSRGLLPWLLKQAGDT
ncbi:MAG TPA: hypothetical protein ENI69_01115, partial [Rhodospirillales bacterium]|nr:hypothetical protein [Rhodospirillales bacterium]